MEEANNSENEGASEYSEDIGETDLRSIEEKLNEEELLERNKQALILKCEGNEYYKVQNYQDSIKAYTSALNICPLKNKKERAILLANRAAAKIKLGFKKSALNDCNKSLELDNTYLKTYLRRANLHEELDNLEESLADFQMILKIDQCNSNATIGVDRLKKKINDRNEKLKNEAVTHLKTLGNIVLKPFGLSTDNFQMVPNSQGGYSVNFVQPSNQK